MKTADFSEVWANFSQSKYLAIQIPCFGGILFREIVHVFYHKWGFVVVCECFCLRNVFLHCIRITPIFYSHSINIRCVECDLWIVWYDLVWFWSILRLPKFTEILLWHSLWFDFSFNVRVCIVWSPWTDWSGEATCLLLFSLATELFTCQGCRGAWFECKHDSLHHKCTCCFFMKKWLHEYMYMYFIFKTSEATDISFLMFWNIMM